MNDPAQFTDTSNRHELPFLFAGQAQKEFTVNEAIARIDLLLHPQVVEQRASEPAAPSPGDCYLVSAGATGAFAGQDDTIAGWDGQQWSFVSPVAGMELRDASSNALLRFENGWQQPAAVADPSGGTTIDAEARSALTALLIALRENGTIS